MWVVMMQRHLTAGATGTEGMAMVSMTVLRLLLLMLALKRSQVGIEDAMASKINGARVSMSMTQFLR